MHPFMGMVPLQISFSMFETVVDPYLALGYESVRVNITEDQNAGNGEGYKPATGSVDGQGRRSSSCTAYYLPNVDRSNLHVYTGAYVTGIGIENAVAKSVNFTVNVGEPNSCALISLAAH